MLEKTFEAIKHVDLVEVNVVRVDQLSVYSNRSDFVKVYANGEVEELEAYHKGDGYYIGYPEGIHVTIGINESNAKRIPQFDLYLPEHFQGVLKINCAMASIEIKDPLAIMMFTVNAASIKLVGSRIKTVLKVNAATSYVSVNDVEGEVSLNGANNDLVFTPKENAKLKVSAKGANSSIVFVNEYQNNYKVSLKGLSSALNENGQVLRRSNIQKRTDHLNGDWIDISCSGVNQSVIIR